MKVIFILLAIVVVALGGGFFLLNSSGAPDKAMVEMTASDNGQTVKGGEIMEKSEGVTGESGSYEEYAPEKIALAESGDVVVYFHADWCPTCKVLDEDIRINASEIPAGLLILKTDYDTETELKKKYGVTYQHTLVQVSADGTMIKKWGGSPTLDSLVAQVQ